MRIINKEDKYQNSRYDPSSATPAARPQQRGFGKDIDSACDAVEVVEKAARLLLLEKSAFGKFVGLKDRDLMLSRDPAEDRSDPEPDEQDDSLSLVPPVIET